MLGDERLQLSDKLRVTAEGQLGLDSLLERGKVELLQPLDRGLGEGLVGKIGERWAAPERERLPKKIPALWASPCASA
jgi:hypothetical protein